jgi:Spy/CpxP family protein refolding chaperone
MRLPAIRVAMAVLAAGLAAAALAQSTVPLPGLQTGLERANLLQNKSVQDELKITAEQDAQLRKIAREFEQEHKDDIAKALADKKDRKKLHELQKLALETMSKGANHVLRPEQFKRLGQIELQLRGIWGLVRSETQRRLNLSDKQKLEIRSIVENLEKGIKEAGKDDKNRAEAWKKIHALYQEANQQALDRLTEPQRKTWKEMVGEPFELKVEMPGAAK